MKTINVNKVKFKRLSLSKYVLFAIIALTIITVTLIPLIHTLVLSFLSSETAHNYLKSFNEINNSNSIVINFGLEQYNIIFNKGFLRGTINSFVYSITITIVQLLFSICQGFCFSKVNFKFREPLFIIYVIMMVVPFQVTIVTTYIFFNHINIIDSVWVILLPGFFSPFGVFLFRQFISAIPNEILEASLIDGVSLFKLFTYIVIPNIKRGVFLFCVLCFIDKWAAIEPALAFIKSSQKMPLSIFLRNMMTNMEWTIFAPSILYIIPAFVIFIFFFIKIKPESTQI